MRVFLQPAADPASKANFAATVAKPVQLATYATILTPVQDVLDHFYPNGFAPMWGLTPSMDGVTEKDWQALTEGDVVAFSASGIISKVATATLKFRSDPLARAIWGQKPSGDTWEYTYFLSDVRDIPEVSRYAFNRELGYSPNTSIRRARLLDQRRSDLFREKFLVEYFAGIEKISPAKFGQTVHSLKTLEGTTDKPVQILARQEQGYLRSTLFSGIVAICALCNETYPTDLMVAAHIKRRADCSEDERKDASNIVMPLCKFGCDDLYERGYLAVAEDGKILGSTLETSPTVRTKIAQLEHKLCSAHNKQRIKYFRWHRENMFREATDALQRGTTK